MQISVKFFEKEFTDEVSKKAYLKACKWVASNVINKVEIGETFWTIKKNPIVAETDLPTFKLELFAALDESSFRKDFCSRCQSFHKNFYINQQYNCDKCNMTAYYTQAGSKLEIKKAYRKERLNYILKE